MNDKIYNSWLQLKNKARLLAGCKPNDFKPSFPYSSIHRFGGMPDTVLDSYYIKTMPYGMYHPKHLQMWFDKDGTRLTSQGVEFSITDNKFPLPDGGHIPNGIGLIHSKQSFGYGTYEWRLRLPQGSGAWPAIWLTSSVGWPPEIDVMEAYSDKNGYGDKVETNIHLGIGDTGHYDLKAGKHGYLIEDDKFFNLALEYDEKFIKIYYNGFLVRRIQDKDSMSWFAGNHPMRVIMGTGIRNNWSDLYQTEPMVVTYFTYSANTKYSPVSNEHDIK